jgi:uncharacterized protein (DUF2249 family)
MSTVKTIDIKGLPHGEREKLIFPNIEGLKEREVLRIIVEFNPVPLVYMLKAWGEFEVSYEKEGPDEWILNVKRVASKEDKKEQLKKLLRELKEGEVSKDVKAKAKEFFKEVDATTLGIVEQELIKEGFSHEGIRKSLCDIHLEFLKDTLVSKRIEVAPPHPINTFMEEHKVILNMLENLKLIIEAIEKKDNLESMEKGLEELKNVSLNLIMVESHHKREEEVLFPKLEKHNITEPPNIMRMDHTDFRKKKEELYTLPYNFNKYDFKDFKEKIIEIGQYLIKELPSHIFKEDNILYQIALQVLSQEEWDDVKKECDKIGYCNFTPIDNKIVELDLRPILSFDRHEKIFELWNNLKPGEALKIINDHDPKPLYYQFEAEYKDKYEWEYEQKGPKDWIVKIKKL